MTVRICSWNVRRAHVGSRAWELFREISPDLALLQEIGKLPKRITDHYQVRIEHPVNKRGQAQKFSTAILVRGEFGLPHSTLVALELGQSGA